MEVFALSFLPCLLLPPASAASPLESSCLRKRQPAVYMSVGRGVLILKNVSLSELCVP